MGDWLSTSWGDSAMVVVSIVIIYPAIVALVRINGLRSFSKMSASDFAMTVAVGSRFATAISNPSPSVGLALIALAGLFAGQRLIAHLRLNGAVSKVVDNDPILLMEGEKILDDNMRRTGVTLDDLHAKLREANVWRYDQVIKVVFETTGDVSVLHGDDKRVDEEIFQSVNKGVAETT